MISTPQVPSAADTSAQQTASNVSTATAQSNLNHVNQNTPTGSLTYNQTGTNPDGTPQYTATTSLAPAQQGLLNSSNTINQNLGNIGVSQSQRLGSILSNPLDTSGVTPLQTSLPAGFTGNRQDALNNLTALQNPLLDRQQSSLNQTLANKGLKVGDEAYTNAQSDFGLQRNNANLQAIAQTGQEQQTEQGLGLNAAQFGNNASQTQLSNATNLRNQQLNEVLGLAGQTQIQNPNFQTTPQVGVQGTDVSGNINQQYQNQNAQSNGFWGGLGSLASTAGSLFQYSDKSLKTDIGETGMKTPDGIPVKTFAYKGSPMMHMGVIAQDVEKKRPDAVRTIMGKKAVDYGKIHSPMLALGRKAA